MHIKSLFQHIRGNNREYIYHTPHYDRFLVGSYREEEKQIKKNREERGGEREIETERQNERDREKQM